MVYGAQALNKTKRSKFLDLTLTKEELLTMDEPLTMDDALNVFGEALTPCGIDPITGFYRDGCCNTSDADVGSHTVCIQVSVDFLQYSRFRGNDLSTPMPDFGFPGLKAGDTWCLCAARWLEAYEQNMAPKVYLMRTHQRALEIVDLEKLKKFALDLS